MTDLLGFIVRNKTLVFVVVLCISMFFIGRLSVPDNTDKMRSLEKRGDSIRDAAQQLRRDLILENVKRLNLEMRGRRDSLRSDSLHRKDKKTISYYQYLLNQKLTPHELQNRMSAIYDSIRRQR